MVLSARSRLRGRSMPAKLPKEDVDAFVRSEFLSPEQFVIQENCLVLNTGEQLALIDTGRGAYTEFGAGGGRLAKTLEAAGVHPEDIDVVILSHGHLTIYRGSWARAASSSPQRSDCGLQDWIRVLD